MAASIRKLLTLFLVTASILPSAQALWELHALSPPSAGRYSLGNIIMASQEGK